MNPSNCSPMLVHEIFRSLLSNTASSNSSPNSHRNLTAPSQPLTALSKPLTAPPARFSIRFIENDQNNRREKYDGNRWRLVCVWSAYACTNLAQRNQLCNKHRTQQYSIELPKKKRKPLINHSSLPIMNRFSHNRGDDDDGDNIQILEEYCRSSTTRHSMTSTVKSETCDFNIFSVEHVNDTDHINRVKSEPKVSSTYTSNSNNDIEYITSTTRSNGLNISESISQNIPPLTGFEEEFIGNRLMARLLPTCSMLDARLFLQNEAIEVVKKNYRIKMDTVAPEYFYDFLLRYPRVAIHYNKWFLRCKLSPPTTGCPIDTKVWTLGMMVRAAMASDDKIDEHD